MPNVVLVLQHSPSEPPGIIQDVLLNAGYRLQFVRSFAGEPAPANLDRHTSGLVIMGGPMGVYEQQAYPFLRDEMRLIESCLADRVPILGTCLGSQLLASALGARVYKGQRKEIGWHRIRLNPGATSADHLFANAPREFSPLHWHGDIFDLPAGAASLASSDLTECQGFRYADNAYGLLFHMEVNAAILNGMVETFANELLEEAISGQQIQAEAATRLPELLPAALDVYAKWAALLPLGSQSN